MSSCKLLLLAGCCSLPALLFSTTGLAEPLAESQRRLQQLNEQGAQTQQRINTLADEADQAVAEYRHLLRKTDNLNRYNLQLQQIIASQVQELASLKQQIDTLEDTRRDIVPLMLDMLASLDTFIRLDIPFLADERQQRLQTLKDTLQRADVTTSEKYRKLLDAYLIEADYGRSIEAYQQAISLTDGERHVDLLRIGRIGLFYQTQDQQQVGFWHTAERAWQPLPDHYQPAVQQGLNMARRQAAPDLLTLPFSPTGMEVQP